MELRVDEYRNSKTDALMRAEIDHLRSEMLVPSSYPIRIFSQQIYSQKGEDNLSVAEAELEKQNTLVSDLTRKVACLL